MNYLQSAFDAVCKEAITAESWYVVLAEDIPYYGGPEEGGWWGRDRQIVAFQDFPSEELAEAAAEKVRTLAKELQDQERQSYGNHCLQTMEWLEARGLDADFLPEPDGPSEFSVFVCNEVPSNSRGQRHYS